VDRARLGLILLLAIVLAASGCGSDSSATGRATTARSSAPTEEGGTIESFKLAHLVGMRGEVEPGPHVVASTSCYGSGGDSVGKVEIRIDTPSPPCLLITPGQRVVFINLTGADVAGEAKPISVRLGDYAARLSPRQAAFFSEPIGSYLSLGKHEAQVAGAPGAVVLVVKEKCMPHGRPGLRPPYSRCF
jgi:hypothetical protein